ncbi:arginine deiminase-related protein [Reichenbachiella carrageenanivorans]|uniref:Arginine deiminase-related protein n=1 Tax=Reichenbachiella carrageenanivorans TaxID=2979869 RepID=A0ABY6D0R7_9BACT|nr:arginine deiminase-related protein [Reichenbachiella carrageenanivorans]UXX79746.1 arginine deiminase-related protein [Reichenbachiella carrageenanivorans]
MGINTTSTIMMVRPVQFRLNEQTAVNNYYQKALEDVTPENVQERALAEFDGFVAKLRAKGVEVIVVNDTPEPSTPDSIFPNNWISFHDDGVIGLYPMYAENRRFERREDIISQFPESGYNITNIIDLSGAEEFGKYLEGTGSLILDRGNRIAYAAVSERTHPDVIKDFESAFNYRVVAFIANQTVGGKRLPIYHTNVMMGLGDEFAVICLDTIDDVIERKMVVDSLQNSGKEIIEITESQKEHFAGNMLQVENKSGDRLMVMSEAAYGSLTEEQKGKILNYNKDIIFSSLDTIEALGGGSARCMMAEVFLPKK